MNFFRKEGEPTYYPHPNEKERVEPFIYNIPIPDPNDPDAFDHRCDPNNPMKITRQDVLDAYIRIRDGIIKTPCKYSQKLSMEFMDDNIKIYLKEDFRQITASFKERGCRNVLLQLDQNQRALGVIAASAGNHALGLAYHGNNLGVEVTVVMPETAPLIKIDNCIKLGARVIVNGTNINEAKAYAIKLSKLNKLRYINGFDDVEILAGQGSVGIEIIEQVPNVDVIIVPVGGGGLLAGICEAFNDENLRIKKNIRIYGVESQRSPGWTTSIKYGKPTYTKCESSLADGLNVPTVGVNSFYSSLGKYESVYQISEDYIAKAILRLIETEKIVVEGAAGISLASIYANVIPDLKGKNVVCILGGGNIDVNVLRRVLERGLAFVGQLHQFTLILPDAIGSIAILTELLKMQGASIVDIDHERAWLVSDFYSAQVRVTIETMNNSHANKIRKVLEDKYIKLIWGRKEKYL